VVKPENFHCGEEEAECIVSDADDPVSAGRYRCRICKSSNVRRIREGNTETFLQSNDFRITDDRYGLVSSVFECADCGFLQCLDVPDTTAFYRVLEDPEYEAGRKERMHQARMILNKTLKVIGEKPEVLRLLDVGAGSGILLEAALELGFEAEGVEPSDWLRLTARTHGCKIDADVIPHPDIRGPYDIVTLIDVVEHVSDPFEIIKNATVLLRTGGKVVIVTPDAKSVAARIMRWKWWHFRIAHVGYFSKENLNYICMQLGLKVLSISRPSWVFSLAYLRERLQQYLPKWLVPSEKLWMHKVTFGLNLRDSLMIVAERQ